MGHGNQGWKDSGNGIVYEDGRQVPPPIATCEIQGYWFAVQQLAAVLSWVLGYRADARALWRSALDLKDRFNRDWWMPEERFIALALDPEKRQARSITSNVGHSLASGIIANEHIRPVVGRLFSPELFSGSGIRTLSSRHPSYGPISYHLSTASGPSRTRPSHSGSDATASTHAPSISSKRTSAWRCSTTGTACLNASVGTAGPSFPIRERTPRANVPQAWNQSAFPLYLQTLLGFQPVAPLHLLAVDPVLPDWLPEITLEGLRLGGTTATLRFRRRENGRVDADIVRQRGPLHLVRQPPIESLTAGVGDRFRALADSLLPR